MSAFLAAGIHDLPSSQYHADAMGEQPALSNSILKILLSQTPRHAWLAHPRLNPDYERAESSKFDLGKAAHALLLEGVNICEVIEADDWRTNAAKAKREEARAAGKTPLLVHEFEQAMQMVGTALEYVEGSPLAGLFSRGKGEQTLLWQKDGVHCRALIDWLQDDRALVVDYKTSSAESPEAWIRGYMIQHGCDTQAAYTQQGLAAIGHHDVRFLFLVQQTEAPHMCFLVEPDSVMRGIAESKIARGMRMWKECTEADVWPGYGTEVYQASPPPWAIADEEMKMEQP